PNTRLSYADYQTRVSWGLGNSDRASVFAFGTFDSISQRDDETKPFVEQLGFTFSRIDARDDHAFRTHYGKGNLRMAATVGYDESQQEDLSARSWSTGLRTELDDPVAEGARLRAGADVVLTRALVRSPKPGIDAIYPRRTDVTWGGYAELT